MSQLSLKWIFVLDENYTWNVSSHLSEILPEGCAFVDRRGNRWLEIHPNGDAKVLAQYAWDGCTPKFVVWDLVFGTPDGMPNAKTKKPKAYYASLLHDVLYQFLDAKLPMSRREADRVFLELLTRDGFGPRWIYYFAVRMFGGVSRLFARWSAAIRGARG
jgi:hypothetical protein